MAQKKTGGLALVIVESPAKARTISKYLGDGFIVESSIGHIRDLPSTAAEIPEKVKREPWARLGVNVEQDFEPIYVIPANKRPQVKKLREALNRIDTLYLATDEDREGEAIAWHLAEVLKPSVPVRRMVFDEITASAIRNAVLNTREIDLRLVDAQETRRILDRLYGYEVSPILWRKVRPKLSAGRVQSVATRLIVDRERARMQFVRAEYWDVQAQLRPDGGPTVEVRLIELGGRRLAVGKDFEETTGQLREPERVLWLREAEARRLAEHLRPASFVVADVTEKPFTERPYAPFITSTLQQEAARKLRFSAQRTMRLAQTLYENGYITYMRTDSTTLSSQALNAARTQVQELYGADYLPPQPRVYAKRSKNAQEAHEAIRPAGEEFRTPRSLAGELEGDLLKLYELIWKRTVASQMKDAVGLRTTVRFTAPGGEQGEAAFTASGKVIQFAGFLRAYVEGTDDPEAELGDQERILPPLTVGQILTAADVTALGHTTQPPARYSEASLIKELEERGIGRPSTYATIIQTIEDRGYVFRKGTALVPTWTAFAVVNLLEQHMPTLVDYAFTARMEDSLDAIAGGEQQSRPWLRGFYFGAGDGDDVSRVGLKGLVSESGGAIDPRAISTIPLGRASSGESVVVRVGRYGPYLQIGDGEQRATIPEDLAPDELTPERIAEILAQAAQGDRVLGHDPDTGKPVYVKTGRYGPYVQLGDPELTEKGAIRKGGKPKMASLWPGMTMESLTLAEALQLLSFPRLVGRHPESDEEITAQDGRFGPYIRMGKESRSLPDHAALLTITLAEALELLRQPKGRPRRAAGMSVLAELGPHPESQAPIQVRSGRFGPYVTDGVVNATVPKGRDPAKVSLADAVELLAERERKLRDLGIDPRAPKAKKRTRPRRTSRTSGAGRAGRTSRKRPALAER